MQLKKQRLSLLLCMLILFSAGLTAFAAGSDSVRLGPTVGCSLDEATGDMRIFLTDGAKSGLIADFSAEQSPFPDPAKIRSVTIDPWIRSIGAYTFAGCVNLTRIEIPDTVTRIGAGAFRGCGDFTVYYSGTPEDWNAVKTDSENEWLQTATVVFPDPEAPDPPAPAPDGGDETHLCPWCGKIHGDGGFQRIIAWIHGILARIFRK